MSEGIKEAILDAAIDEVAAVLGENFDEVWKAFQDAKKLVPGEKAEDLFLYPVGASIVLTSHPDMGYGTYAKLTWSVKHKDETEGITIGTTPPAKELPLPEDNYEAALAIIKETKRASTSSIQRRLKIGYTEASRIMDLLEEACIVGPPRGSDPREILISLDPE